MGTIRTITAAAAGLTLTGFSTWHALDTIIPTAQPTNPQPAPSNPQPQPSNPSPRPGKQNPQPRPGQQNPQPRPGNQNPVPDPNNPGAPNNQPPNPAGQAVGNRALRPFAFQSPDVEGRFNLTTRRLVQMEQRMQRSHDDLLKRLGQARQLSGQRQTDALFEVIQQMLQDEADLQRYLVQSRTAWTGDVAGAEGEPESGEPAPETTGSQNGR
jgi:hypothetical protein